MSTARLDTLRAIEKTMQQRWEEEKPYEAEAPRDGKVPPNGKYFITFPYPYMNGKLHLGHGFSLSKSEFAARFWRMKGRHVLWPFALHCTGTPIAACAQKLTNEMAMYGNPPVFQDDVIEQKQQQKKEAEQTLEVRHKSKRAKTAPTKPQWMIMQDMKIPDSEIPSFANPDYWLNYFPPKAVDDLKALGCHIDFRRSFITTDRNPWYDSFIKWQFRQLRAGGYLNYGNRYSVYSPLDGQPCADHDRASGEGVLPQEYTVVKLRVKDVDQHDVFRPHLEAIAGRDIILPGATLRAETVVGQTNCWVSPNFAYKAFSVISANGTDQIYLMTQKAARNMAFQGFVVNGTSNADVEPLFEVDGAKMIGLPLAAPLAPYDTIYTLPMHTITETKGTGVVMSVPSDSPDDYINLIQLIKKPEYRAKLGLKDEWVMPFNVVPILEIQGELGQNSAQIMCEKLKINGPNATDLLEEAKKQVYQAGFYSGVMIRGPFSGEKVSDAKVKTSKLLMEQGNAIRYFEPMKQVMSRSGDECVVALCAQWYIEYGKEEWKQMVTEHLHSMQTYFPGIRHGFEETLNWLADWPCSRTFGLGTKLPCDESNSMIIDSLSDSTIYMAYYTIAHFLHTDREGGLVLDGRCENRHGLTPAMFTDAAWDFIFKGIGSSDALHAETGFPVAVAEAMRNEFQYWYPVDLRVSAKDLIQNHLTMFLYNHAAIWPNDRSRWPRSIYCNGHIQVDSEKMSKSKGNFVSVGDALVTYGADATRLTCADAGDSLDDANFVRDTAVGFIMKLTTLLEQIKEFTKNRDSMRSGAMNMFDRIFDNSMNVAIQTADQYYQGMSYRMALNTVFYELGNEFSQYKINCDDNGTHKEIVQRFFEITTLMLMPFCPHFCDYVWRDVLGHPRSIMNESFPQLSQPVSYAMRLASRVLTEAVKEIRAQVQKNAKKRGPVTEMYVYVSQAYNDWQRNTLAEMNAVYDANNGTLPADTAKIIAAKKLPWMQGPVMGEAMAFMNFMKGNVDKYGVEAMSTTPAINDKELLESVRDTVSKLTQMQHIHVVDVSDETFAEHKVARSKARPGEPTVAFPPQK